MAFHNIPPNGFPDIPDMEELEAVVKDVTTLKTSVAGLASDVSNLSSSKANQITIAPFFSAETAYEVGDLVYYNGLSYRCTNDHEGEWDADDFAATTIANELDTLKNGLMSKATVSAVTTNSDNFTVTNPNQNGNYYTYGLVVGGFSTKFTAYLIRCGVNTDEIASFALDTTAGTMTFTRDGSTISIACSAAFYGGVRVLWLG